MLAQILISEGDLDQGAQLLKSSVYQLLSRYQGSPGTVQASDREVEHARRLISSCHLLLGLLYFSGGEFSYSSSSANYLQLAALEGVVEAQFAHAVTQFINADLSVGLCYQDAVALFLPAANRGLIQVHDLLT